MKKHQRYFPVYAKDGGLLPYFIAVRNGDTHALDVVADGNEQVIRARFADAAFFVGEDLKHKLEDNLARLGTLTFQFKLGSMLDKSQRVEALVEKLRPVFGLDEAEMAHGAPRGQTVQGRPGHADGGRDDLAAGHHGALLRAALRRERGGGPGDLRAVPAALRRGRAARFHGRAAARRWPTGWIRWRACLPPGWPPAERKTRSASGARAGAGAGADRPRRGLRPARRHAAWRPKGCRSRPSDEQQAACLEFIAGRLRSHLLEEGSCRYDVVDAVLAEQSANPLRRLARRAGS